MTISPRGAGVWQIQVDAGRDPLTGRRRRLIRTIRGTKRDARTVEAELRLAARDHADGRGGADTTLAALVATYLAAATAELSPTTLVGYRGVVRRYLDGTPLADRTIGRLTVLDLERHYRALLERGGVDGRPLRPASVRQLHAVIRRALGEAERWGWIPAGTNPATRARAPRIPRDAAAELPPIGRIVDVIRAADPDRLGDVAFCALSLGARLGELCALRWSDLEDGVARIRASAYVTPGGGRGVKATKTRRSTRRVALPAETAAILEARLRRYQARAVAAGVTLDVDGYVFSPTVDGGELPRTDTISHRWAEHARAHDLPLTFHGLRHAHATLLVAQGIDLRAAAARLGHDPTVTLAVYAHPDRATDERAARIADEALRLRALDAG